MTTRRGTRRPSEYLLAAVGDLHCGSTVGLHPEDETPYDDGGAYTPSVVQRWLWSNWSDYWQRVAALAEGRPVSVLFNGDLVDGDHHKTTQIIGRHPGLQMDVLRRCVEYVLATVRVKRAIIVRGTASHTGQGAPTEESFARWLLSRGVEVPRDEDNKAYAWRHFTGDLGGVRIDVTHHGRVGGRPWTAAGGVTNLSMEILANYALKREPLPDLAIRSHNHQAFDTGTLPGVRILALPAWQLGNDWVKQVRPDSLADIGGGIVRVRDGQIVQCENITYRPARPIQWRPM